MISVLDIDDAVTPGLLPSSRRQGNSVKQLMSTKSS